MDPRAPLLRRPRSLMPDWPGVMREATARAYLDAIVSAAEFRARIAPQLEARTIGRKTVFTRLSIDRWLDRDQKSQPAMTTDQLARLLENGDGQDPKG